MKISINVKRKFKINGKEYHSLEEVPADIRESFKKAIGVQTGSGHPAGQERVQTRIIFNGAEYADIDAMPQDVRQLYETAMKAAENGTESPDIDIPTISGSMQRAPGQRILKTESSFSPRTLAISVTLVALVLLLYYLISHR